MTSSLKFPRTCTYWSQKFEVPVVCQNLSHDRFSQIQLSLKFLIYDDVELETKMTDHLCKARSLLETVCQQCLKLEQEKFLSIDEQTIQFAGRYNLKQYIPNRPNSLRLKDFVLAGSLGLVCNFTIYQGKTTFFPDLQSKGLGTAAVLHLLEEMKENSRLYFDRYFTSIWLLKEFTAAKVNATRTVMKNHLEGGPVKN